MMDKQKHLVNILGGTRFTPLHIASECGHNFITELLLNYGADITAK